MIARLSKGKFGLSRAAAFAALFACASVPKSEFIPLRLQCAISSHSFPGMPELKNRPAKEVVLSERSGIAGGEKLVDRVGDFEFWVSTGETVFGRGRLEVKYYFADIRDMKTQISARTRSNTLSRSKNDPHSVKSAIVSLQAPRAPAQAIIPEVSMHCFHATDAPQERLILRHE